MRPLILAILLSLLGSLAQAQTGTTNVTAHVVDSNGVAYANSPVHITFYDPGTSGQLPLINGSTFQTNITVFATDSAGNFSVTLTDNNQIAATSGATGTQWTFGICYSDGVTCFNYRATISGSSMNISAALTAAAPIIVRPGVGVTSVGTQYPLVGGPITGNGTVQCPTCADLTPIADRQMMYNNAGTALGADLNFEPITHKAYSHLGGFSLVIDNAAVSPSLSVSVAPGAIIDSALGAGNCVQADGSKKLVDSGKPCNLSAIQLFGSSVVNIDLPVTTNTLTTVTSVNLVMPATGCPCRADARWRTYYTTNDILTISSTVTDGTNTFASGQTRNTVADAETGGDQGAGFSPGTYANNANVTFTLKTQGNAAYTISAAPFQGPGENSGLQVVIVPSN